MLIHAKPIHRHNVVSLLPPALLLGLAIGFTGATFAFLNALVLNPLPIEDVDRIVTVGGLAEPRFIDPAEWWSQNDALESIAQYFSGATIIDAVRGTVRVTVVSAGFFEVFDQAPIIGRTFDVEGPVVAENDVAVVSYRFWRTHFGTSNEVLGSQIRLNGKPHRVVGVMPDRFRYPSDTQVWVPRPTWPKQSIQLEEAEEEIPILRIQGWVGKLRRNSTVEQARERFYALLVRLHEEYTPTTGTRFGNVINVTPIKEDLGRRYRTGLLALMLGGILTVLAAGSSSTLLLIGRATQRTREFAIVQALGATPGRMFGTSLLESVRYGLIVAVLAALIGLWLIQAVNRLLPYYDTPAVAEGSALWVAMTASCVIALLSVVLMQIIACSAVLRTNLSSVLSGDARLMSLGGRHGASMRRLLVITQVALACLLTLGSSSALETFRRHANMDLGFDPKGSILAYVRFPDGNTSQETLSLRRRILLDGVRELAGVTAAATSDHSPITWHGRGIKFIEKGDLMVPCVMGTVSPEYFTALGVGVVSGGLFRPDDADAVIINEMAADLLWREEPAVGQSLTLDGRNGRLRQVVGVVRPTRNIRTDRDIPQCFIPEAGRDIHQVNSPQTFIIVRCPHNCSGLATGVYEQLKRTDSTANVYRVAGIDEIMRSELLPKQGVSTILSAYGLLGLVLAMCGVYALVWYSCLSRRREIAIRAALGADTPHLLYAIVGEGLQAAAIGGIIGVIGSLALNSILRETVFGWAGITPVSILVANVVVIGTTAVAAMIPALTVSRQTPWSVLHQH